MPDWERASPSMVVKGGGAADVMDDPMDVDGVSSQTAAAQVSASERLLHCAQCVSDFCAAATWQSIDEHAI